MKIHGKDIILTVNEQPVAASTGCTFEVQQEFIDVCSPTDGRAKKVIPGRYEWSASVDCLCNTMVRAKDFMKYVKNGTMLIIKFKDKDTDINMGGSAYLQHVSVNGKVGGLASVTLQLIGSGELTDYGHDEPEEDQ